MREEQVLFWPNMKHVPQLNEFNGDLQARRWKVHTCNLLSGEEVTITTSSFNLTFLSTVTCECWLNYRDQAWYIDFNFLPIVAARATFSRTLSFGSNRDFLLSEGRERGLQFTLDCIYSVKHVTSRMHVVQSDARFLNSNIFSSVSSRLVLQHSGGCY